MKGGEDLGEPGASHPVSWFSVPIVPVMLRVIPVTRRFQKKQVNVERPWVSSLTGAAKVGAAAGIIAASHCPPPGATQELNASIIPKSITVKMHRMVTTNCSCFRTCREATPSEAPKASQ